MRRVISFLLTLVLLAGILPAPARAEDVPETTQETVQETVRETTSAPTEASVPETGPETEPIVQPETEPVTEPATEQETMPETVPETIPETVPDTEPELLIEMEAVQASDGTGTVIASGPCGANGDNVTYVLTDDGTLTISGSGAMKDYWENNQAPWYNKRSQIKTVVIEQGVASIGDFAFQYCNSLTSVTIPSSVTSVGYSAFQYCSSLTSVTIPNGVTCIRVDTFNHCRSLASVTIPNSVISIDAYAFQYCSDLTSVTIPSSVTYIGQAAFAACDSLTDIDVDPNNQFWRSIDGVCFSKDMRTLVAFPAGRTGTYQCPDSVTSIGNHAFGGCSGLTSVVIPNSVTSIGNYAFDGCSSLTGVVIPSSVTSIGEDAFRGCSSLTSVTIPNSVTSIGGSAFFSCNSLTTVSIPSSVTSIGEDAFGNCRSLTEINVDPNNQYWCSVDGVLFSKDMKKLVKYPGGRAGAYKCPDSITSIHDYAFAYCSGLTSVTIPNRVTSIGDRTFAFCRSLTSVTIPNSVTSIGGGSFQWCRSLTSVAIPSSVTSISNYAFDGCFSLKDVYYGGTEEQWSAISIMTDGNEPLKNANIHFNSQGIPDTVDNPIITSYNENHLITINNSGRAYAYYRCAPETTACFTVNGTENTAKSDEKGIVKIPLGEYNQLGEHTVTVSFTKIGDEELFPAKVFTEKVKVEPLSFKQEWKASMDVDISGKIGGGAGIQFAVIDAEATFGQMKGTVGAGNALNISRGYSVSGETLELTSEKSVKAGGSIKSGVTGDFVNANISLLDLSAGTTGNVSGTYGIRFSNYLSNSSAHQRAIATFLLGEALEAVPNSLFYKPLYNALVKTVYKESGCDIIQGCSVGATGSVGAGSGAVKVNDVDLFSLTKAGAKFAVSSSVDHSTSGEVNQTTSIKTSKNLSLVSGDVPGSNDSSLGLQLLKKDFLGRSIKVTATKGSDGKSTLSTNTLSAYNSDPQIIVFGQTTTSDYTKYQFKDEMLKQLCKDCKNVSSYLNGTRIMLSDRDITQIAGFISGSTEPIPYTIQTKEQTIDKIPLKFGLDLIAGGSIGLDLSYMEGTSYSSGSGYAMNDQLLQTSESFDLSNLASHYGESLQEMVTNCLETVASDIQNFFTEVVGSIKDGVKNAWSWITKKADSTVDWVVSITCADGSSAWAQSYRVDAYTTQDTDTVLGDGINIASNANYELTKAATIGRPFLVSVKDGSGAEVTDFHAEPLEFTIRYADSDLQAAGLSRSSGVVRRGGIAMYRYSDSGDYFEYVGGSNDLDAMTVTATILRPGQYILAADGCAPELRSLELSNYRATPVITAQFSDMTGLNLEHFRFVLDGECRVDGSTAADYFDPTTCKFTYEVSEDQALAEGIHTMEFTLEDTSGNGDTYSYQFPVDLTDPEIMDVAINGTPNSGKTVEILAQVRDTNLTAVMALLSERKPDGTWTEEVAVQLGSMGDGQWGLDYVGTGRSIRVRILAEDIAGNTAESDSQTIVPLAETVTLPQKYILLYQNQTATLQADVAPSELAETIVWSAENPEGTEVISVSESGEVTARNVGTAYVLATAGSEDGAVTARCRVDVAEPIPLQGVRLGTKTLTTELFRTKYASFDVILLMQQNMSTFSTDTVLPQSHGVAVESARFADTKTASRFDLVVKDDRTLLVVPKQTAIDNPDSVGKSYTSKVLVNVCGTEYETSSSLVLTVKKSTPKLTASTLSFNSFYTNQAKSIALSGATVTGISRNTAKDTKKTSALPKWLTLSDGVLTLSGDAPTKSTTGKVYVRVSTQEWAIPASVTVPVKLSYQAPGLKLSASSKYFATANSRGVALKLLCSSKKDTLEKLRVSGITAPDGFTVTDFNPATGALTLLPTAPILSGTKTLKVTFSNTEKTLSLKMKVSTKSAALTASPSTVSLNGVLGDSAVVKVSPSPSDYQISAVNCRLRNSAGQNTEDLDITYEDGKVLIKTISGKTRLGETYTLYLSTADTSKATAVTIKIPSKSKSTVTASVKASKAIDLTFPDSYAVVTPAFSNYTCDEYESMTWSVAEYKGKKLVSEHVEEKFAYSYEDGQHRFRAAQTQKLTAGNTYKLRLSFQLRDGRSYTCTTNLTVTRTAVKLKLSKTSLSLNKAIQDTATIKVRCLTKGYLLGEPVLPSIDGLNLSYESGKLRVTANENAKPGVTYKVQIRATAQDPAVTLSVKISTATTVTATLKTRGSIDVVRDGTAIVITPSYKNYAGEVDIGAGITIQSVTTARGDTYRDVPEDWFTVTNNANGTFTVTKNKDAQVNTGLKYRAVLSFRENVDGKKATVSLSVKSGEAKVSLSGTPVLYRSDRNSRGDFRLTVKDTGLNPLTRVTFKEASHQALFTLYEYGGGNYALGFRDNTVQNKTYPTSVVLNLFFDGNTSTKPNATVTLKPQVR